MKKKKHSNAGAKGNLLCDKGQQVGYLYRGRLWQCTLQLEQLKLCPARWACNACDPAQDTPHDGQKASCNGQKALPTQDVARTVQHAALSAQLQGHRTFCHCTNSGCIQCPSGITTSEALGEHCVYVNMHRQQLTSHTSTMAPTAQHWSHRYPLHAPASSSVSPTTSK